MRRRALPIGLLLLALLSASCRTPPAGPGPAEPPAPPPAVDPDHPARYMARMSLEQKIGQRLVCFIRGTEITETSRRLVREAGVSGVILYPWNVVDRAQVRDLNASLQAAAMQNDPPARLFIAADQEGGRVAAFRLSQVARMQAAYYQGELADPDYIRAAAYITARDLRSLGCNMNFAPVLDLYGQADTTIIGDRSMGADPERIGLYGLAAVRGAQAGGVIPVVKHFPGHGSSTVDSHGYLPVVDLEEAVLLERDFLPFRLAVAGGVEAVMTAHVLYPSLDPDLPATLSPTILRDLLRRRFGFEGVVISDGLAMGAIARYYPLRDTLALLFQAGVDLILVHSQYDPFAIVQEVLSLLAEGRITMEQIDEGVRRVLELKNRHGLLPDGLLPDAP